MTYFVGLDLSLRKSGVVVIDGDGRLRQACVLGESATKRPCNTAESRIAYFRDIAVQIANIVNDWTDGAPAKIAIESPIMYSNRTAQLIEMRAVVMAFLLGHGMQELPPLSLKFWATGDGTASSDKGPQIAACKSRFGFVTESGDVADAYLLAQWMRSGAPRTVKKPLGPKALANRAAKKQAALAKSAATRAKKKGVQPEPAESIGGIETYLLPF